jgi:hypothetical protein
MDRGSVEWSCSGSWFSQTFDNFLAGRGKSNDPFAGPHPPIWSPLWTIRVSLGCKNPIFALGELAAAIFTMASLYIFPIASTSYNLSVNASWIMHKASIQRYRIPRPRVTVTASLIDCEQLSRTITSRWAVRVAFEVMIACGPPQK